MKCKQCGAELEADSMFCPECGARCEEESYGGSEMQQENNAASGGTGVPPAGNTWETGNAQNFQSSGPAPDKGYGSEPPMMFCPNCGTKVPADTVFCPNCGSKIDGAPADTGKAPGTGKKKWLIPAVVAGVAVVAAVGIGGVMLGGSGSSGGKGKSNKANEANLIYFKDGGIYYKNLKKLKKDSVEYTDDMVDKDRIGVVRGYKNGPFSGVTFTKDGKYCYYPEQLDDNGVFRLMKKKVGSKKEGEKIDGAVSDYTVLDSGNVIFQKDNDALYLWNGKDKEKIASDIEYFVTSEKGDMVLWLEDDGGEHDIYYQKLTKKGQKEKLESGVEELMGISKDLSRIYFRKNGAMYLSKNQGEKEKLADDIERVVGLDREKGTFYYTVEKEITMTAADYVEDDKAASDSGIQEPNIKDYQHEELRSGYFSNYYETVTDKAYYTARSEYEEKQKRDRLRQELKEEIIKDTASELYFFDGKDKVLICDNVDNIVTYGEEAILYTKMEAESIKKIKLSELYGAYEVANLIHQSSSRNPQIYIATTQEGKEVDVDAIEAYGMDTDRDVIYGLEIDGDDMDAIEISYGKGKLGEIKTIDEDVEAVEGYINGNFYYYKDLDGDHYSGDLYVNGERLASDVAIDSVTEVPGSSKVVCITDGSSSKRRGELTMVSGKKAEKIADDVSYYDVIGEKSIIMLVDYNFDRSRGDLKYYGGKEAKKIDTDVTGFCYIGKPNGCP